LDQSIPDKWSVESLVASEQGEVWAKSSQQSIVLGTSINNGVFLVGTWLAVVNNYIITTEQYNSSTIQLGICQYMHGTVLLFWVYQHSEIIGARWCAWHS